MRACVFVCERVCGWLMIFFLVRETGGSVKQSFKINVTGTFPPFFLGSYNRNFTVSGGRRRKAHARTENSAFSSIGHKQVRVVMSFPLA